MFAGGREQRPLPFCPTGSADRERNAAAYAATSERVETGQFDSGPQRGQRLAQNVGIDGRNQRLVGRQLRSTANTESNGRESAFRLRTAAVEMAGRATHAVCRVKDLFFCSLDAILEPFL
jgi:hypothetical protein